MTVIRAVLGAAPVLGKGHRKVWARLRWQGVRTSKARVLRLMRAARLLAPTRVGHAHGPKAHEQTITMEQPDQMWGMDATSCLIREGTATVKEQLLWVLTFDTVEELHQALLECKDRDNRAWLCERHGHQTPAQVRAALWRRTA